jgi:hypothetical protein
MLRTHGCTRWPAGIPDPRDAAPGVDRIRGGIAVDEQPTRPSPETRDAERQEAQVPGRADREPTEEEAALAEEHEVDPEVAERAREMAERGARQQGEGRIP